MCTAVKRANRYVKKIKLTRQKTLNWKLVRTRCPNHIVTEGLIQTEWYSKINTGNVQRNLEISKRFKVLKFIECAEWFANVNISTLGNK